MLFYKRNIVLMILIVCWMLLIVVMPVAAQTDAPTQHDTIPDSTQYTWELVVGDFDNPLYVTAPKGDNRIFIVEQLGTIWAYDLATGATELYLDVSLLMSDEVFRGGYTEQGLLGLAFDPHFAENHYFYISYINKAGDNVIARYQQSLDNPMMAEPNGIIMLTIDQPAPDHNGGHMVFGPDGYLYIGIGDGGPVLDPNRNGQKTNTLLGKMLRIDVSSLPYMIPASNPFLTNNDYLPEIWAIGLRNPWRFSFDRLSGDLYIGDVGQTGWEEIDLQPASSSGGENYGWSYYEGLVELYTDQPLVGGTSVEPIAEYDHTQGCSVVGGYVYRGQALPELQGYYIGGDYCTGRIWSLYRDSSNQWQFGLWIQTSFVISSFGEDAQGELYVVDYKGGVYRLVKAS